jgi:hypothetical protein
VAKIASRVDGSVTITLDTPELAPAKFGEIFALRTKQAFCYLKPDKNVTESEAKAIDGLQPEMTGGKTMSKRLRDVLYRAWEQDKKGYEDSELYYRYRMSQFIDMVKNELA